MGVIRSTESLAAAVEDFRHAFLRGTVTNPSKGNMEPAGLRSVGNDAADDGHLVCVTGSTSFLGLAIVRRLFSRGYSVRLALESQEDLEKLRKLQLFDEMEHRLSTVMISVIDIDSLHIAFDGCVGVFHTSTFVDPQGVSGYNKQMAEVEARTAEIVVEACVQSPTVRRCVFTSSLLACVWRRSSARNQQITSIIIDESCWSDEGLCREKKLWYALGKTMAEKAAWRTARGRSLKMATVCTALVTGHGFLCRSSTASIAYLKRAEELLAEGMLATVDVDSAAEAHLHVYEARGGGGACGRYLCFDDVVRSVQEAIDLGLQLGMRGRIWPEITDGRSGRAISAELSKAKLSRLMSSLRRCAYDYLESC